jgi:hypothetical protein
MTSLAVLAGFLTVLVLGSSPTLEDQAHADDPINDKPPAWQTLQYASPDFGRLKNGDGHLTEMGQNRD